MPKHWIRISGLGAIPPNEIRSFVAECADQHNAFLSRVSFEATGGSAIVVVSGSMTRLNGILDCLDEFNPAVIRADLLVSEEQDFL